MTTVLVTGFGPFGPHESNPSEAAVQALPDRLGAARIVTGVLPVEFGRCAEAALALVADHSPDAVILTGLAAGRAAVTPERVAINVRDTGGAEDFADNAGYAPSEVPILPGGPDGIFATLPNQRIVSRLVAAGIPAEISNTAGTFICNETMYAVLTSIATTPPPRAMAGFVHLPDVDALPLTELVRALGIVVEVVVDALAAP